ncbi:MAG: CerR family C-terminal domain-containing protein [Steroidobacteraceae bacterium]
MPKIPTPKRPRTAKRPVTKTAGREDGAQTRRQLIEVAGRVFAEQGYVRATSKEICEIAGTNLAAVNYHFDGKDGLYAAVLEEAHARLVSIEFVATATRGDPDIGDVLRTLLTRAVGHMTQQDRDTWALRVLSREILAPTPLANRMIANQVLPKFKLMSGPVARALGVPANHPSVNRCLVNIIGPCAFLLITNPDWHKQVFPSLSLDAEALVEHMVTFALGGLQAVADNLKRKKSK